MNVVHLIRAFATALGIALAGCAAPPAVSLDKPPSPALFFLDLASFDRDLAASLNAGIEKIDVSFYDPVSPNALPERIEKWIAAVQSAGGQVTVQRPAGEPSPKGPLALIGLIGAAFNSAKTLAAVRQESVFRAARGRDVVLTLERDKGTSRLQVAQIAFVKSTK